MQDTRTDESREGSQGEEMRGYAVSVERGREESEERNER